MELQTLNFSQSNKKQVNFNYLMALPANYQESSSKKFPLLLFLHGSGERGNHLAQLNKTGIPRLLVQGKTFSMVIASPQCPAEQSWDIEGLYAFLDHLVAHFNVDEQRIYLTGLSMGGQATWLLANAYPEKFAAIAPICAPYAEVDPCRLQKLPIWCFHGAMDSVVSVMDSIKIIKTLRQGGCSPKLTLFPDADHDSWTETYNNPKLYQWLLRQRIDS